MPKGRKAARRSPLCLPDPMCLKYLNHTEHTEPDIRARYDRCPPMDDRAPDVKRAIEASRAMALQRNSFEASLEEAMRLSQETALREEEESDALRMAIEASLAETDEKAIALGLGSERWSRFNATTTVAVEATAEVLKACAPEEESQPSAAPNETFQSWFAPQVPAASPESVEVAPVTATHSTFKVSWKEDIRRFNMALDNTMDALFILSSLSTRIEEVFHLDLVDSRLLYIDDDGDACTLVEETVADFLKQQLPGKPIRLFVEPLAHSNPAAPEHELVTSTIEDEYEASWALINDD